MSTQKHDARRLPPSTQEELRRRVVRAILDGGMRQVDAIRTFGVSRGSVHNWLRDYESGGDAALKAKKRGPKRSSRLKGHQAATVVRMIEDRHPEQLHLPFALWTRDAVRQLISDRYGIDVSVWTVGRYLKRWGFTPQKPLRRAYERNPEAVRTWLRQTYPAIETRAKAENARIYWADEMGLRSDHQAGTSYGRRGRTPAAPGTGQRFGCNMVSAITNRGKMAWMVFHRRFATDVFLEFLRRLIKHAGCKVFLIVDGHPAHRSRKTRRWLGRHADTIRLFYLPGYSPELNPDEYLNQDVKSNGLARERPRDRSEMVSQVRSYLRSTQRRPAVVRNYFNHRDVRYAAAP